MTQTTALRSPERVTRAVKAPERTRWLLIAVFVLLAALVKVPQLLAPMGQDQGLYNGIANEILHGGVPYRDAWDPKPPGVFYAHAALLAAIGDPWRVCSLGGLPGLSHSQLEPRCGSLWFGVVDFGYGLVVAALVFLLTRRLGLTSLGASIAFGLSAVFINLALLDPEGSTPEKYALGPSVGVLLAGLEAIHTRRRRWFVVAGLLGAVAVLFKQPNLASFGALSLVLVSLRRGRDLIWLWTPLAVVLCSVWAAFAVMGAGNQIVDATIGYNLGRFRFQSEHIPFAALVAAWQVFRDGAAVLWLLAAVGVVLAWQRPVWRVLVIWAACDILALFLGGTKFTRQYFVQLVPSFSALAALAVQALWGAQPRAGLTRAWLVLSLAAVAILSSSFQAGFSLRIWNEYVAGRWTITSVEHLASMIRQLPADETLFVWGDEAQLYPLARREPTTRFLNAVGLAATGDPSVTLRRAELISAITRNPPSILVVDRRTAEDDPDGKLQLNVKAFPELQQLLAAQYRQMDGSVLRSFVGGGREQVYLRQGETDLCAAMAGCRLS